MNWGVNTLFNRTLKEIKKIFNEKCDLFQGWVTNTLNTQFYNAKGRSICSDHKGASGIDL